MAQQYASGSVHLWMRGPNPNASNSQPNASLPRYFGTCESMPNDSRQAEYEPVMTDTSGTRVPYDVAWQGQSAQISLVMTRVEQGVVEDLLVLPAGNANVRNPGQWRFQDVGTMMASEGKIWEIWLGYSFGDALGDKSAYVRGGLNVGQNTGIRPGRHYLQCVLWAPQMEEAGSKPMKQHFMLYAWPKANKNDRVFTLYDYDFTGINANSIT